MSLFAPDVPPRLASHHSVSNLDGRPETLRRRATIERAGASHRMNLDAAIRGQVELVVFHAQAQLHLPERRSSQRRPFPYPVEMTPLGADGKPDRGRSFVVVGKHLSDGGLDFYHREPLADKKLIASFDIGRDRRVELLLDLTWCRFNRHGWYEQGGRFVAVQDR